MRINFTFRDAPEVRGLLHNLSAPVSLSLSLPRGAALCCAERALSETDATRHQVAGKEGDYSTFSKPSTQRGSALDSRRHNAAGSSSSSVRSYMSRDCFYIYC
eukprot:COSAG06_NODE_2256_length_7222_cov_14.605363_9_plen_103_part_00